jgi:hypothetical protein
MTSGPVSQQYYSQLSFPQPHILQVPRLQAHLSVRPRLLRVSYSLQVIRHQGRPVLQPRPRQSCRLFQVMGSARRPIRLSLNRRLGRCQLHLLQARPPQHLLLLQLFLVVEEARHQRTLSLSIRPLLCQDLRQLSLRQCHHRCLSFLVAV